VRDRPRRARLSERRGRQPGVEAGPGAEGKTPASSAGNPRAPGRPPPGPRAASPAPRPGTSASLLCHRLLGGGSFWGGVCGFCVCAFRWPSAHAAYPGVVLEKAAGEGCGERLRWRAGGGPLHTHMQGGGLENGFARTQGTAINRHRRLRLRSFTWKPAKNEWKWKFKGVWHQLGEKLHDNLLPGHRGTCLRARVAHVCADAAVHPAMSQKARDSLLILWTVPPSLLTKDEHD